MTKETRHAILSAHRNGLTVQLENILDLYQSGQLEKDAAEESAAVAKAEGKAPGLLNSYAVERVKY